MGSNLTLKVDIKHISMGLIMGVMLAVCMSSSLPVNAAPGPLEINSLLNSSADYRSVPPYLPQNVGDPNVIISLDTSGSMKAPAYGQTFTPSRDWHDGVVHTNYDADFEYFGYFSRNARYVYDTDKRFFVRDDEATTDFWRGNFLNWLTMRRIDVARKLLVGGKVRDRDGEIIDGQTWYVLEGQQEQEDREFFKQYSGSDAVSPYPSGTTFMVADGQIFPQQNVSSSAQRIKTTVLQDGSGGTKPMEMGQVSFDAGDEAPVTIPFQNTYIDPVVIVGPVTFNSGRSLDGDGISKNNAAVQNDENPLIARTVSIGASSFDMRLQRWEYLVNGGIEHPEAESVFYLVAEKGSYNLQLDGGTSLKVVADKTDVSLNCCLLYENISFGALLTSPAVFSSVGSFNDATPVVTRNQLVTLSGFQVALQEEAASIAPHNTESVHWVAIESGTGLSTTTSATVDVGITTGINSDTQARDDGGNPNYIRFKNVFADNPIVVADMQTTNDTDPASLRLGSRGYSSGQTDMQWGRDAIGVIVEEEASSDPLISHDADEDIGYIAVEGGGGYNIRVGILDDNVDGQEEPTGLVQDRDADFRMGLAVANFQHSDDPGDIYYVAGNETDGGTLHPCYPDVSLPISPDSTSGSVPPRRTTSDICKETHVKAPLGNLIDVIEDYPLTLGNSPVTEVFYNIAQYVSQTHHEVAEYNSAPWPIVALDSGNSPTASYQVSNAWDPYYYDELGGQVACAQTYVMHITDGVPNRDWDNAPVTATDGDSTNNGENEALDDLAHELRNHDARDDLEGHQEIISYLVLASLGLNEDELDDAALRRLREAAANGGFVDDDEDHLPDVAHPADFNSYVIQPVQAGSCTLNEWDQNGDCNPDTFSYATQGNELLEELRVVLADIKSRSFSGGAASSMGGSTSGAGAIYQATFEQEKEGDNNTFVNWTGDVTAMFVDTAGRLRDDGGTSNKLIPNEFDEDKILYMCFDGDAFNPVVRVHKTSDPEDIPTMEELNACSGGDFGQSLDDINYIWSAGEWLADPFTSLDINRVYGSANRGRHIITAIDGATEDGQYSGPTDNRINSGEQVQFVAGNFTEEIAGLIREREAGDTSTSDALAEAHKIVNWVRGIDDPGLRSRALEKDGETLTWRLGDIINSSPVVVGAPSEDLDVIYSGTKYGDTYRDFRRAYLNRRTVVYAGGNDGMLHAFNAGSYDRINNEFNNGPDGKTQFDLGAELWAYVPYNLLPHLEYLATAGYGGTSNDHLAMVDFTARVFDARIFGPGDIEGQDTGPGSAAIHPGGWGTILVGAMRLGGGPVMVDANINNPESTTVSLPLLGDVELLSDPNADLRMTRPAIFILDITDPEEPPKLLLEYSSNEIEDLLNIDGSGNISVLGTNLGALDETLITLTDIVNEIGSQVIFPLNLLNLFDSGHTLSMPAPIISGYDDGTPYSEKWHLAIGSGLRDLFTPSRAVTEAVSTNPARVTLIDLETMEPESQFGGTTALVEPDLDLVIDGDSNPGVEELDLSLSLNRASFVTGMLSVDYDLDVNTDAVYFTTVSGNDDLIDALIDPLAANGGEPFSGALHRITMREADTSGINSGPYLDTPANWTIDTILTLPDQPVTAMPNVTVDENRNRWILFGTGRYYIRADGVDSDRQAFYGVKEPRGENGFTWGEVLKTNMTDVSNVEVRGNGDLESSHTVGGVEAINFNQLVDAIVTNNNVQGWYRDFNPTSGERNIGQASILGGTAAFTTFEPPQDVCKFQGESRLYAVDYRTGTATPVNILNTPLGSDPAEVNLEKTLELGKGLVSTVTQHVGKGYTNNKKSKAGALGSSGALQQLELENTSPVTGGEVDWRVPQ